MFDLISRGPADWAAHYIARLRLQYCCLPIVRGRMGLGNIAVPLCYDAASELEAHATERR